AFANRARRAGPGSRATTVTSKPARARYHALVTPITPLPRPRTRGMSSSVRSFHWPEASGHGMRAYYRRITAIFPRIYGWRRGDSLPQAASTEVSMPARSPSPRHDRPPHLDRIARHILRILHRER